MLLDLRHVRWLEPLHVVAAAAYAQRAHAEGSWLELAKVDPSSATYAARMGLGDVIDSYGGRHNLPPSMNARNRGDTLLEVRRAADARHWAELVHERSFGTAGAAAGPLFTGLAELGEDIILHSGTEGFVAAQTYQDARLIRFPVADAGVGLRTTLAGRGATSDYHALHLALTGTSRLDGARLRDADHLGTDPQHRGIDGAVKRMRGRDGRDDDEASAERLPRDDLRGLRASDTTVPARRRSLPPVRRRDDHLPHRRRTFDERQRYEVSRACDCPLWTV